MANKDKIIEAFLAWYPNDPHASQEDYYRNTIKVEYLKGLSKEEFISFFSDFAREGGQVQSGGQRTAPFFQKNITEHYDEFRANVLEPFNPNFDLDSWLNWADEFNYFGQGLATVYLNRVDKRKFVIVNEKVINALPHLGFDKPASTTLTKKYYQIREAEQSLLREFPALDNFFKVDSLMHFLIGTGEGKSLITNLIDLDYFDLEGLKAYAPMVRQPYIPQHPATRWYKNTQKQLEQLVYLLAERLGQKLTINYTERPRGQQGGGGKFVFKDYVLVGVTPNDMFPGPKGDLFIKLFFGDLSHNPVFALEIDINDSNNANPFRRQRKEIREKTYSEIIVDESFPKNWSLLLDAIENNVRNLIGQFISISQGENVVLMEKIPQEVNMRDLNIILYGPPGTGKTYSSKNLAIQIIENKNEEEIKKAYPTREELNQAFLNYQKNEQIGFVTFHQSFGYEDFIEGIKPKLVTGESPDTSVDLNKEDQDAIAYKIEDGIFKIMAERADSYQSFAAESGKLLFDEKQLDGLEKKQFFKMSLGNTAEEDDLAIYQYCIENNCIALGWGQEIDFSEAKDEKQIKALFEKNGTAESRYEIFAVKCFKLWMKRGDIVFISDGNLKVRAIGLIDGEYYYDNVSPIRYNHFRKVKWLNRDTNIPVDQIYGKKFSQQTIYAMWTHLVKFDFFRKPEPASTIYQNHVLIIDEINRGNISSIFGELITLIEPDKRKGEREYFPVTLPYSKRPFSVPPNLYIIGTMNTADRSVEALDTALRRRFSFIHMKPEAHKLKPTREGIDLNNMLTRINKRLEVLLDADHTIGHAWLWNVDDLDGLRQVFKDKILPLLREFFYNDYEKIGLVLGDAFVRSEGVKPELVFANFENGSGLAEEYASARLFYLNDVMQISAEQFSAI